MSRSLPSTTNVEPKKNPSKQHKLHVLASTALDLQRAQTAATIEDICTQ